MGFASRYDPPGKKKIKVQKFCFMAKQKYLILEKLTGLP